MPDLNPNDALAQHIVTPTSHEADVLIKRRKLYKMADKDLARDWVITALNCKKTREYYKYQGTEKHGESASELLERPFMDFPATLWQRLESRFGASWYKDKKLKKKVWEMYPEFRLREKL